MNNTVTPKTNKELLEEYKTTIDNVFTPTNVNAILAVIDSFYPVVKERVQENEYFTTILAAKLDYHDEIRKKVIEFVINRIKFEMNERTTP